MIDFKRFFSMYYENTSFFELRLTVQCSEVRQTYMVCFDPLKG